MPSTTCSAVGCSNNPLRNPEVLFHKFPTDRKLEKVWVNAVRRVDFGKPWTPTPRSKLCSDHFSPESYERNLRVLVACGLSAKGSRLKKDAVPSLFAHRPPAVPAQAAYIKRRRIETVSRALESGSSAAACASPGNQGNVSAQSAEDAMDPESMADAAGPDAVGPDAVETSLDARSCISAQESGVALAMSSVNYVCMACQERKGQPLRPASFDKGPSNLPGASSDSECSSDDDDDVPEDDGLDSSYSPDEDACSDEDSSDEPDSYVPVEPVDDLVLEPKFIVTLSRLLQLLTICLQCLSPATVKLTRCGSLLRAAVSCASGHHYIWENQPKIKSRHALNLLLCGAIAFSGASPTCVLRLLSSIGIAVVQKSQYFDMQKKFLHPAAVKVWRAEQALVVRGGRADSPGYSAKYGTYSLMEMNINRIIHFEIVQSTEVKSSSHMEKEGLKRSLDNMINQGLTIGMLVTDRHIGVKAMMKSDYSDTRHRFDAWHLAKGKDALPYWEMSKGKNKILLSWLKSIRSHVYWCAQTSGDNGDLVLAKWTSLLRHMSNVHEHPNALYPACSHGDMTHRWWLQEGKFSFYICVSFTFTDTLLITWSEPYVALHKIVMAPHLIKDIPRLSGGCQTYNLEAFHSLLIHFTPKSFHFGYAAMVARTCMAVLHYNANADREQAKTLDNKLRFSLRYPKARKGNWSVRGVPKPPSYDYVKQLLECSLALAEEPVNVEDHPRRPSLCSTAEERPQKEAAVRDHVSRFRR
ncbi:hypothetical protein HPB47_001081 [Ixodes persulcatus]|uniref:Uncharacterized protein n=1 Tax=Ixodes persulcatus TaxID=34615 RepID=A0AC60PQ84_IXOPE|nr:hypothetical protein HPB47_001081 [Ixodes persulcatus]